MLFILIPTFVVLYSFLLFVFLLSDYNKFSPLFSVKLLKNLFKRILFVNQIKNKTVYTTRTTNITLPTFSTLWLIYQR